MFEYSVKDLCIYSVKALTQNFSWKWEKKTKKLLCKVLQLIPTKNKNKIKWQLERIMIKVERTLAN